MAAPVYTPNEPDFRGRITEWLDPSKIFQPRQIMTRAIAEEKGWNWWKFREPYRRRLTNKQWLRNEQSRLADKGIKTKVETRGSMEANSLAMALFEKE